MTKKLNPKADRGRESAQDGLIMGTNNSSIVSKRSVERLYYPEPHFFRYFVKKPQRRSPLINRGYWLRMQTIEHEVLQFLHLETKSQNKIVINLGCGYDPLPFQFLAKEEFACRNTTFIDIDYDKLMRTKRDVILETQQIRQYLPSLEVSTDDEGVLLRSPKYLAIGCDLRDLSRLDAAITSEVDLESCDVLFVAEVSLTYMEINAADTVIKWASKFSHSVQFCLLEQFLPDGPDHPFAKTMLSHFEKLQAPLKSITTYPSLDSQAQRFIDAGWEMPVVMPLWNCWQGPLSIFSDTARRKLDFVEPFDEWEEYCLFSAHYFVLRAHSAQKPVFPRFASNLSTRRSGRIPGNPIPLRLLYSKSPKPKGFRRYGAAIYTGSHFSGLHGGLGQQTRLPSTDYYTLGSEGPGQTSSNSISGDLQPVPAARMCHTITSLNGSESLLVGGRTSPGTAMSDCWINRGGEWIPASELPVPRYRHCATGITLSDGVAGVLVFGGKQNACDVLADWVLWQTDTNWRTIDFSDLSQSGRPPSPRYGASLVCLDGRSGLLFGGLSPSGVIIQDIWMWKLRLVEGRGLIECGYCGNNIGGAALDNTFIGRFGASVCVSEWGLVVAGGVSRDGIIGEEDEVLVVDLRNLDFAIDVGPLCNWIQMGMMPLDIQLEGPRPLLIGHSLSNIDKANLQIVGGGAVCFSFGTYWNEGTWTLQCRDTNDTRRWALFDKTLMPQERVQSDATRPLDPSPAYAIPSISGTSIVSSQDFERVFKSSKPAILKKLDIGPCLDLWTMEYLRSKLGSDRVVTVHEAQSRSMNFQNKNFQYAKKKFGDFLDEVEKGGMQYLRSISAERPSDTPARLEEDFPELASDFKLPPELAMVEMNAHSSPLRISGPVAMWLHYDVMANVLCQIQGTKRLVLYPPSDVLALGLGPGASTSTIDVFEKGPALENTHPLEAILQPGDTLFIPPLWLHTAAPTANSSIAVNVFFRSLSKGYAAGRDVYGNRDLAAYENGRRDVDRIIRSFKELPPDMSRFYLERLSEELRSRAIQA